MRLNRLRILVTNCFIASGPRRILRNHRNIGQSVPCPFRIDRILKTSATLQSMSRTTASPTQSAIDRLLLWLLPLLLFLTGSAIGYALLGKLPRLEWMPPLLPPLRLGLALLAGGLLAVLGFALLRPTPATATVLPASTPVPAAHAEPLPAAVRVVSPSAGQSPPARPLPVLKRESIKATPVTAPTADTTDRKSVV